MRQVLAWALDHDPAIGLRLAVALAPWWLLRGRLAGQYPLLCEIAGRAEAGSERWCAAQMWLGRAALSAAELAGALGHFTAVIDAAGDQGPSRVLADALAGRSSTLLNLGRLAEGTEEGRRSLAMARELGYPAGEGTAMRILGIGAWYSGDYDGAIQLIRQQQVITGMPDSIARQGSIVLIYALIGARDLAAAESACAAAVAQCRDTGDVSNLPSLLMVLADLIQHVEDTIRPRLEAGEIVVCDRYLYTVLSEARARTTDPLDTLRVGTHICGGPGDVGGFTEGLQLFASFAMLMNFPRFNKMKGMGQIVSWSVRDESLHCEGIVKLYHAFNAETGAVTKSVADDIVDCCKTVVSLEDRFIDLAFDAGEVQSVM